MKRIFGLDIVRATAILLVLFSHSSNILAPYVPWLRDIGIFGFLGVELFFVLSGFLIGSIIIKAFLSKGSKLNMNIILNFWKRRWFRTLPNYYLFLFFNIALLIYTGSFLFDWKYLLFLQNISVSPIFFSESWSLAVEEWFYLLFPLLLISFFSIFKRTNKDKLFIILSVLVVLLISSYRFIYVLRLDPSWELGIRKILFLRIDSIMYGVILAYIKYKKPELLNKYKIHSLIFGLVLLTIVYIQFFTSVKGAQSLYSKTFYFNFVSLSLVSLLPFADSLKGTGRKIDNYITFISLTSYSLYLLHNSIILVIFLAVFKTSTIYQAIFIYLLYWFTVLFLSGLTYKYFEKPILEKRENVFIRKTLKESLFQVRGMLFKKNSI